VDVNLTRYFDCVSRCVRRAFLCAQGFQHRKHWIEDRLGTSAEVWGQRIQRLLAMSRLLGSYFSADRDGLRQLARQRGVHTIDNLAGSTA
jgi:hypothetical protein